MGCVTTWMSDCLSAQLASLMTLRLTLVDQNLFRPCLVRVVNENLDYDTFVFEVCWASNQDVANVDVHIPHPPLL